MRTDAPFLRFVSAAALLLFSWSAAGCGEEEPAEEPAVIVETPQPQPSPADTALSPGGTTPDGGTAAGGTPSDGTAAGEPAAGEPAGGQAGGTRTPEGSAGAAPGGTASSQPQTDAAAPRLLYSDFEGTAGIVNVPKPASPVRTLQAVRAAQHRNFDRIVFEFEEGVPGYRVEYIDEPVRQCGSGHEVDLPGEGWLSIRFEPAQAHTEEGHLSVKNRTRVPDLRMLQEHALTCDFEAVVTWVLGLRAPNRYRVQEFASPPRLVVDIKH